MLLIPVKNSRYRSLAQFLVTYLYAPRSESQFFCGFAYAEHGNTPLAKSCFISYGFGIIMFAVMFGDHSKARRAAIHCVYLLVIGERHGAIAVSIFKKQKLKDKEKYLKQACL